MTGRMRTSDLATIAILVTVVGVLTLRLPRMWDAWALHVALLAGFLIVRPALSTRPLAAALVTIGVMFTLYLTLATIPFEAFSWRADALLSRIDEALFLGTNPSLWIEPYVTPPRLEFFSFVYALFIPYIYLSMFFGLVGRPDVERRAFTAGIAVTYALGFLGYLFLPARGPVVYLHEAFAAPLQGGAFHDLIVESVDRCGGPHGAFPSLHVGISTFLCLFDLRWNRLRGLTYLPLVVLIMVATVIVRYHYVIDVIAGLAIAWLGLRAARRAT